MRDRGNGSQSSDFLQALCFLTKLFPGSPFSRESRLSSGSEMKKATFSYVCIRDQQRCLIKFVFYTSSLQSRVFPDKGCFIQESLYLFPRFPFVCFLPSSSQKKNILRKKDGISVQWHLIVGGVGTIVMCVKALFVERNPTVHIWTSPCINIHRITLHKASTQKRFCN